MNMSVRTKRISCVILLLMAAQVASAQDIYKCAQGGRVEYTDRPCPGNQGELIHHADDQEVIDQYLDLGQDAVAKRYSDSRHLDALYKQRVEAYNKRMEDKARQQANESVIARQRDEDERQRMLVSESVNRERLQAENETLRQQNDEYRDQLSEPAPGYVPDYWVPPYRDHDHDHRPHPSGPPVFHPCRQLAGGRVQC